MRRALREALPAITEFYGLMPWHFDGGPPVLTYGEIETYSDHMVEVAVEQRLQQARGG